MAGRRTNLALLGATTAALITGIGAFVVGTPSGRWVVVAHGVVALSLLVLAPWKAAIMTRGMRRPRPGRATSLALSATVGGALVSGVLVVTGESARLGPFSPMQVHVGLGVAAVALTALHTWRRPVPLRRTDLGRRQLIRLGGLAAAATTLWLIVEGALEVLSARGSERRFTGSHEVVDSARVPATQWLNDTIPHLDPATHLVTVDGVTYGRDFLAGRDTITATLDCTGGWYTTQEFAGTRLDRLVSTRGRSLVVRSVTGYWRRFPMEQAHLLLLATHMAGAQLADGNGGPVRLVAPGRRGYWWVKWVASVEVDELPPWWQPPLPLA